MQRNTATGVLFFVSFVLILAVSALPPQYSPSSGRHVCGVERFSDGGPVERSYCIPQFQSYVRLCEPYDLTSGYCTGYRTVYKTVTQIVQRKRRKRMAFLCCPGWSREPSKYGCTKPICDSKCQNGGRCSRPNLCTCRKGFKGNYCDEDIDECQTNNGGCDQQCVNIPGSSYCTCREGYKLGLDGKTCKVCLDCSEEWKAMEARLDKLEKLLGRLPIQPAADAIPKNAKQILTHSQKEDSDEVKPVGVEQKLVEMEGKEISQIKTLSFDSLPTKASVQNEMEPVPSKKQGQKGERGEKGNPGKSCDADSHTDALKVLVEKVAILESKLEECRCTKNVIYRAK